MAKLYLCFFSEFMGEENNEQFWKFVDLIVSFRLHDSDSPPRMQHEAVIKAATIILGNNKLKLNLLKFSLGLRMYSPKIEMFHQVNCL